MNSPPRKIPETGLFRDVWKEVNKDRDFMREIAVLGGRNIKKQRTLNGTLIVADPPAANAPSEPGVVKQFRVKEVRDDFIRCHEFDGSTEGADDIFVAKPFELRRTGWDGTIVLIPLESYPGAPGTSVSILYTFVTAVYRTASFTAGGASTLEHQIIGPRYIPNRSVIFASQSENGTGVDAAEWIDLNADGRAWMRAI